MNKERIPTTTQEGNINIPERLRQLDKEESFAVLATNENGFPYASLISFAVTSDLKNIIFATPKNTRKYRNIVSSQNVALLIDNRSKTKKSVMRIEALTIIGKGKRVKKGKLWDELTSIFSKKHPDLVEFVNSTTTALISIEILKCIHVSRFQTISIWDCQ